MKKVTFYTLGCKLNYSESSTISRMFEDEGFSKVEFHDKPDVFVINTCSVTENADKKCRKVVKDALKISPNAFVAIIGCFAQLKPKEISEIPGVDAVLGAADKFKLLEKIKDFSKRDKAEIFNSDVQEVVEFHHSYSKGDRTRTFLKVQDGCDYTCSFCTIPMARGGSRSDTIEKIIQTANEIATTDIKEVVLTGVNIGDFGIIDGERKESFFELVQELDKIEGIDRFRISSIEPNLLKNEIIEFVANSNRFVPHFHIPLQSGSNVVLKMMRRRYLRELYADRVAKIKEVMPNCCIGVDVIVGFPGETDELFNETVEFIKSLDVSYLHVFTYSERNNTVAKEMGDVVPLNKRHERSEILRNLSEKKRRFFYENNLGMEDIVLFEGKEEDGIMNGFTKNYVKVEAKYDPLAVNTLRKVKLEKINANGLMDIVEA